MRHARARSAPPLHCSPHHSVKNTLAVGHDEGRRPEFAKKKGRAVSEPDGKCVFEVDANGDAATSKHILDVLTGK